MALDMSGLCAVQSTGFFYQVVSHYIMLIRYVLIRRPISIPTVAMSVNTESRGAA